MTTCPKCKARSGDDWSQCKGSCPMPMSPHYADEVLIADGETDGLLDQLTKVWTIQLGNADTDEVTVYSDHVLPDGTRFRPLSEAIERIRKAKRVVFHNGIGFDWHVIERFWPGALPFEKVFDTLVAARMLHPEYRAHRLRDWGERLGVAKGDYEGDFQTFTSELVIYAEQDIRSTRALYRYCMERLEGWGESIELEHKVALCIFLQERTGFRFDVGAAQKLEAELRGQIAEIETDLQSVFPPIWVPAQGTKPSEPFVPKRPNRTMGYVAGAPFCKVELQLFNPGSRAQAARRLMKLGWKPKKFGADGVPTMDEDTLAGLPWKEAKALRRYFATQKLLGAIADGKQGYLKLVRGDRIHGRVNPVGCSTHRMSHFAPNTANVPKDPRARSLFIASPGWELVGVDGEGIQARVLAHYLARYDGGVVAKRQAEGKKEEGTDVHSANLKVLKPFGLPTRDGAKNILYALTFGAKDPRLAITLKEACLKAKVKPPSLPNAELGAMIRKALAKSMKGLDKLQEAITKRVKTRKYLTGIDGRRIPITQDRLGLVTLCQAGEAVLMKWALVHFHFVEAPARGWVYGQDYQFCSNVHDEVQMEAPIGRGAEVGAVFAECIRMAGEHFNLKCPFKGEAKVGPNWAITH